MPATRYRNTPIVPLPKPLRVIGSLALLIVLLYGAGWVLSQVGSMVSQVLIPIVVGVLLAALLMPTHLFLNSKLRFPRHVAAAVTVVGLVAASVEIH